MSEADRWPVHPPPSPLESLSSWLERLAAVYRMPVKTLTEALCAEADLAPGAFRSRDMWAQEAVLALLASHTGVSVPRLRSMTLEGWVPWLFEKLGAREFELPDLFGTYVRAQSVLLLPGATGRAAAYGWGQWHGPWLPVPRRPRACPRCAADPGIGRALVWQLPLMVSCAVHRCRLERAGAVACGAITHPTPVNTAVSVMDGYTYAALTTGRVELPGRNVHAGVWFRLLRCVLDELAVSPRAASARSNAIAERIWRRVGHHPAGRTAAWPIYEHLDPDIQDLFLRAAAEALAMAAQGEIPALGELGPALVAGPRAALPQPVSGLHAPAWWPARPIPAGPPRNWQHGLGAYVAGRYAAARVNSEAARTLLQLLTRGCRTLDCFEEQRIWLFSQDIPLKFLPTADRFGRHDLQPVTAAELLRRGRQNRRRDIE